MPRMPQLELSIPFPLLRVEIISMPIVKNVAKTIEFRMRDVNGAGLAGTPTAKLSKDQGAFTTCTNSVSAITGLTGAWYIALTQTEMNADCVWFIASVASGLDFDLILYT